MPLARLRYALLALAASCGISIDSLAQGASSRDVSDRPACSRCTIVRTVAATLHSAVLEGEIDEKPLAVRLSPLGEYWILSQARPPRVYDSDGGFSRTVGGVGSGPGEFLSTDDVVWLPGDSTLILDGLSRRGTIISRDGRPLRNIQLPANFLNTVVLTWPSRVLSSARISTPSAAGHALHFLNFAGPTATVDRSFSPAEGLLRPSVMSSTYHFVERTPTGRIFSATPRSFRVFEWTVSGHLKETLVRQATWFEESSERALGTPEQPPSAAVVALHVDAEGLIWLYVRIPAPQWREAWAKVPPGAKEVSLRQIEWTRLFNTRLEVIDAARGEVLSRTDIQGMVLSAMHGGLVAVYGTSALGDSEVRIERLRLRRDGRP